MKQFFKYILFFVVVTSVHAQTSTSLKVAESEEFKDKFRTAGVLAIHTTDQGNTGLLRSGKKQFLLNVFDEQLNKKFTKVIESSKKESFNGFISYGNEIKFITVFRPKKRERIVYCHTFNIESQSYSKKELFKANVEKGGLFTGKNKRQTNVAISPNGQYFAIATDRVKKNLNSYMIHVYDTETLALVYKKSYQEDEEKYFVHNDLIVDDNGDAFTVGKLYKKGKSQKRKGEANYQFVLHKISKEENKNVKVSLGEDEHISSLIINSTNNKLQLIGFYSEDYAGRIKGGCNFKIDPKSLSVLNKKKTKLPEAVYKDLYGKRKAERKNKKKKELKLFYVDYVIEDSAGNTYLLAEEFYITTVYVNSGNGTGYWRTIYHYDDILVMKFNAEGGLDWGRSIFKKSNSPSYNVFLKDDKLHVILNSGKNLTEKKDGRTKVSQGWFESSSLYDITYDDNGEVNYNKIQDNRKKTYYLPYFGTYNQGKFTMMSSGRKKRQFMTLE